MYHLHCGFGPETYKNTFMTGSMLQRRWPLMISMYPFMCNPPLHVKFLWVEPLITRNKGNQYLWREIMRSINIWMSVFLTTWWTSFQTVIFISHDSFYPFFLMSKKYSSLWQHLFLIFLLNFEIGSFFCVAFCIPILFQKCIIFQ